MIQVDVFTSQTCSACPGTKRAINSAVEALGASSFEVNYLDIMKHRDAAIKNGIMSVPAVFVYRDGTPFRQAGVLNNTKATKLLREALLGR